jgi:hypothetical protein
LAPVWPFEMPTNIVRRNMLPRAIKWTSSLLPRVLWS